MEERLKEFVKRVESEEARIRELVDEVVRKASEIREAAKANVKKAVSMLEELRNDIMMVKAAIAEARGRLRGELAALRSGMIGLEPELREEMRELLEEAREALDEFDDSMRELMEDLMETLRDLRKYVRDVAKARRTVFRVSVERGSESIVVSSIRLPREDVEMVDMLVEAGIFRSRSEAVAYFTHKGLEASRDLLEKVKARLEELRRIREELVKEFKSSEE